MSRHSKFITSVVCLLLCVSLIVFGVYADKQILFSQFSKVSFTPTTAKLKIFAGIYGDADFYDTQPATSRYYACNFSNNEHVTETNGKATFDTWEYKKINFNDYDETKTNKPEPIYFLIQITNYVERSVDYSIDITKDYTTEQNTNIQFEYYYYLESNFATDSVNQNAKLTTNATANNFWDITKTESSKPGFAIRNNMLNMTKTVDTTTGFTKSVSVPEGVDTSLSTVMLVIKLVVGNADESINLNFGLTVNAV